ncbi:hypothetical protein EVAR_4407_1 [Eumeta japonica]|uniref:Uncharacterized protein n=1 Tax=Eumeta variegata TaxID=151549 RepID=A0A4C1T0E1_EUMVA|nr:hypothetical protein EVAR_4407_1 [Eumeta japonica]
MEEAMFGISQRDKIRKKRNPQKYRSKRYVSQNQQSEMIVGRPGALYAGAVRIQSCYERYQYDDNSAVNVLSEANSELVHLTRVKLIGQFVRGHGQTPTLRPMPHAEPSALTTQTCVESNPPFLHSG